MRKQFPYAMMKLFLSILLCAAMAGCEDSASRKQRQSAEEVEELMSRSGSLTIYSLDPEIRDAVGEGGFHGYRIIGHKEITDSSDKKQLLLKLAESIRGNSDTIAACFNPRHGLQFREHNEQIDFVICFQCLAAHQYGGTNSNVRLSGIGSAAFDSILDKYGVLRSD